MALNINHESKNREICNNEDHITGLIKKMHFSFEGQQFCDVTLIAGNDGIKVKAHRMVLSAASEYFLRIFSNPLRKATAKEIPMKDVNGTTLKSVINFIYTASIELATDTVEDITKIAHLFQLDSLQDVCCNYIAKQLDSSNCIGIMLFAAQYHLKSLYATAEVFVCQHFMDVFQNEEFLQLDNNQLGKFLSSDDLHVHSEEDVFHSMMSWVEYNRPKREQFFEKLLHHIRFPLLLPKFISSTIQLACNSNESLQLISKAYQWHLIPDPDHRLSLFADEQTHLRNFKNMIIAIWNMENANATMNVGLYFAGLEEWLYMEWPSLPEVRTSFGSTTIDGKLIIAGGILTSGEYTDRVDCLDMTTLKWTELPPMGTRRSYFRMVTLKGRIYALGGCTDHGHLSSVETYDPVALQWKNVTPMHFSPANLRVAAGFHDSLCASKYNGTRTEYNVCYSNAAPWTLWFNSSAELLGMGVVCVASTNFFIALLRRNIIRYNLETDSKETIDIDYITPEYTECVVVGDKLLVYGKKKFLQYDPFRNERKAMPDLKIGGRRTVILTTN